MRHKWTKIDKQIKKMMLGYPGIFPSRIECLNHLFTKIGTGYDWNKKGSMSYHCPSMATKIPSSIKLEKDKKYDPQFPEYRFETRKENLVRKFVEKNIKTVVQDCHFSTTQMTIFDIGRMHWWDGIDSKKRYLMSPLQRAVIYKNEIQKDWRYEIKSFCDWVISKTYSFVYDPGKKEQFANQQIIDMFKNSPIRRLHEFGCSYEVIIRTRENILTDEEVEREKKSREELLRYIANKYDEKGVEA